MEKDDGTNDGSSRLEEGSSSSRLSSAVREDDQRKKKMILSRNGSSSSSIISGGTDPSGGSGEKSSYCQVDKCTADIAEAKGYHKRHRVCKLHAKAGCVVVCGDQQRFCQQCSRFHILSEFDYAKRSCRRSLDGHNRRRRKNIAAESQPTDGSNRLKESL